MTLPDGPGRGEGAWAWPRSRRWWGATEHGAADWAGGASQGLPDLRVTQARFAPSGRSPGHERRSRSQSARSQVYGVEPGYWRLLFVRVAMAGSVSRQARAGTGA